MSNTMPTTETTNTANSGLDILYAAIEQQSSDDESSSSTPPESPSPSPSPKQVSKPKPASRRHVSYNPFRSKMDPRMKRSIAAKTLNPNMLDEDAVLAGFVFPERGMTADIHWIGEDNVSMRQRKINFRRSWQRHQARKSKELAAAASPAVVLPSPNLSPRAPADQLPAENYLALPKRRSDNTFPITLSSLLSNPELNHIISWLPSGDAFGIHKQEEFENEILPKYFRQARFNSFVRKLNRWGFHRVSKSTSRQYLGGSIVFCREDFKRDAQTPLTMMRPLPFCNTSSAELLRNMPIDDLVKEAAARQATLPPLPAMMALRPSISLGQDDLGLLHELMANYRPSDRMMSGMNRLLIHQQQHLFSMSQRTERTRALLNSMRR